MTDDFKRPQSSRPPVRGTRHYEALNTAASAPEAASCREIFHIDIKGIIQKGHTMNKEEFAIELAFKPLVPNLKLRPQETQLLLAYLSEILKEIEAEEKKIIDEEKTAKE